MFRLSLCIVCADPKFDNVNWKWSFGEKTTEETVVICFEAFVGSTYVGLGCVLHAQIRQQLEMKIESQLVGRQSAHHTYLHQIIS